MLQKQFKQTNQSILLQFPLLFMKQLPLKMICFMQILLFKNRILQQMNNLQIEISRPHYVNRNQQYQKKEVQHTGKISKQSNVITVFKSKIVNRQDCKQDDQLSKVKELKAWLFKILSECKANLQEELINKRNMILLMKKEHQDKLMRILKEIQQIRKKAYEQYRHQCTKKDQCSSCHQRGLFFSQQIQVFLNPNLKNHTSSQQHKQKGEIKTDRHQLSKIQRDSSQSNDKDKTRRSSIDHLNTLQMQSNDSVLINQQQKVKIKPLSKFKKIQTNNKVTKKSQFRKQSQNILNQSCQKSMTKRQQLKNKTRYQKSVKQTNQQNSSTKIDLIQTRMGNQQSKRIITSRNNSVRHSVLKTTLRDNRQDQKTEEKLHQSIKSNDTLHHIHNSPKISKLSKFQPNHLAFELQQSSKNSHLKRKGVINRNNKYLKKSQFNNSIEVEIADTSDNDKNIDHVKTEREQIEQLIKQANIQRHQDKKISRYKRQRMFYHILKKQLLRGSAAATPQNQQIHDYSSSSQGEYYLLQASQCELASANSQSNLKKYSLKQRKQSLINKLAMLNQSNAFQNIKGKIDDIINKTSSYKEQEKVDKCNSNNIVNAFLSQVLKISDLKRLTKEKFFRESVWSPQMRQMHQFCTYLEYSLQAFQSKLKKTAESSWRQLSFEGKVAQSKIDDLILDNKMGDWKDIDLSNIGEQNHRQIECSMKYYGIDIKRLNNFHQSDELPNACFINPISNVYQRSMKEIKQMKDHSFFRIE